MEEIQIRRADVADVAGIEGCLTAAYADAQSRLPDLPDVTGGLENDVTAHIVYVATCANRVVGAMVLIEDAPVMKLANLGVDPEFGGCGIAGRLLRQADEIALAAGCRDMILRSHAGMSSTRGMYRHLGWRETDVQGQVVTMQKRL